MSIMKNRILKRYLTAATAVILTAAFPAQLLADTVTIGESPSTAESGTSESASDGVLKSDGETVVLSEAPSGTTGGITEGAPAQSGGGSASGTSSENHSSANITEETAAAESGNAQGTAPPPETAGAGKTGTQAAASQAAATQTVTSQATASQTATSKAATSAGRLALDFSLAIPAHDRGDILCAEGSVQLKDGSWQMFGYKSSIRNPYYRILRTVTDTTGVDWHIVACHGRRIGDAYTSDGTMAEELWLKASDCRTQNYIDIENDNERRAAIVRTTLGLLGCGYSYGKTGPDVFDCSGLVNYVMKQNGIEVPRSSGEICAMQGQVSQSELRPGDIVGRNGHVGIYIGGGVFVHASETSVGVIAQELKSYNASGLRFTNYINVVGDDH